ncbi:pilus assembly FimT family protein [Gloeobacter kilaueensis]|uniref:Major pilin subunit n=1 Tax=Gloeobacter kilaueensis (strain ATCC BAA-2537 / CCAP 1431/1 / ULC 316 / JS1) TaxID=1183438 RepID=U5QDW1_GLOK1|nr:prepilin-type N-terminal cleavage/methylation domain-containing protein [Gloeobacter kilaueensis]AGY57106.1 major pilin subunit [Gloeobacter kilaueensis JS1]
MSRRSGFTLLELVVVMAIVFLLAGFGAVSGVGLLQSRRFDSGLQDLAIAARKARSRALEQSQNYTFEFTLHDPTRNLSPDDPPDHYAIYGGSERPAAPDWQPLPDHIWIDRTTIQGPPYRWQFDERGTVQPSQIGTILLQDGNNPDPGLASLDPHAPDLLYYLRSKQSNGKGLSRGIVMNTYLGKISAISVGTQEEAPPSTGEDDAAQP